MQTMKRKVIVAREERVAARCEHNGCNDLRARYEVKSTHKLCIGYVPDFFFKQPRNDQEHDESNERAYVSSDNGTTLAA